MDLKGVKAIRVASDATVLSAAESRQDIGSTEAFGGGEEDGTGRDREGETDGRTRTEEPSQIHSAVGLRRIDRARARRTACAEYKCKRREYAADPLAIPFTSRHSYAPAVTVRPESRGDPLLFDPLLSLPRILHPLIGARVRSATRNYARQLYSRSSNSVLLKLSYARNKSVVCRLILLRSV